MRRLIVAALAVLAAACGDASIDTTEPTPVLVDNDVAFTSELALDVYRPDAPGPWPVVVLVPGGSWRSADRSSTAPLAADLASRGAVVFNTTYRLMAPDAFGDVGCALRLAGATAADYGGEAGRLVLVGVSAGAHVASVVAFSGDDGCPEGGAAVEPQAFVGLAGPYDVEAFGFLPDLRRFFGGSQEMAPDLWDQGNPYRYLNSAPPLRIALLHGEADIVVPVAQSRNLAAALEAAGAEVTAVFIDGIGHNGIADPAVAGDDVAGVILELAG